MSNPWGNLDPNYRDFLIEMGAEEVGFNDLPLNEKGKLRQLYHEDLERQQVSVFGILFCFETGITHALFDKSLLKKQQ